MGSLPFLIEAAPPEGKVRKYGMRYRSSFSPRCAIHDLTSGIAGRKYDFAQSTANTLLRRFLPKRGPQGVRRCQTYDMFG